ncbi:MAG: porin [Myxococcaceae bacterium]
MRKLSLALAALLALPALAQTEAPPKKWFENVELFGYAKAGYFFVTPSQDDALVGSRSGFRLANLRVGMSLKPVAKLEVVASVDGSVAKRNETDALNGNRVVDLKDAYVEWSASPFAHLRIGQFKAPFDQEALLPDGQLPFISRSVVSDGMLPPEGYPQEGMSLDRQVGLQLSSEKLGPGLRYEIAVVNGNGPNVLNNDSNAISPVARFSYQYKELVTVGVNGFFDQRMEGQRPNRIASDRLGYGGDLGLKVGGVEALAVVLLRGTTHPGTGLPPESALGLMGQVHYRHTSGVEGGVRFASYDPSSIVPTDRVMEGAAMVGYRLSEVPLRVLAQYTLRLEEPSVSISNDSVDVMAQVTW